MNLVLGVHHVGVNVVDLDAAVDGIGAAGFAPGPVLHLDGPSAARGNGLESIDMRVCFVANSKVAIELLEHRGSAGPGSGGPGRAGDAEWLLPGDRVQSLDLPGVTAVVHRGPLDLRWSSRDPDATGAVLDALELVSRVEGGTGERCWLVPGGTLRLDRTDPRGEGPRRADMVGRSHLALRVTDAARAHDLLRAAGHQCWTRPIPHEDVLSWFFVRDPGGVALEIVQDDTTG